MGNGTSSYNSGPSNRIGGISGEYLTKEERKPEHLAAVVHPNTLDAFVIDKFGPNYRIRIMAGEQMVTVSVRDSSVFKAIAEKIDASNVIDEFVANNQKAEQNEGR